jgi:transcriptional regulator with XRE-family HTH domain
MQGVDKVSFSRHDRKAALYKSGRTGQEVATALDVDPALVSHVLAGRRLTGPDAQRVMIYMAGLFGVPLDEAFPEMGERGIPTGRL